jgi:L-asparaginase
MHRYENGQKLQKAGVVSGFDMTTEAALAKLMILFGSGKTPDEVTRLMPVSLRGELTRR